MILFQPRFHLRLQPLREANQFVSLLVRNGTDLIVDIGVTLTSTEVEKVDLLGIQANRPRETFDRSLRFVLPIGLVASRRQGRRR